ncbi:AcrR family transcriptional regulator [Lipingzhangella halophila]|uniref:AcrR family transcriptional regulator n=1 Tax=Lipingzhangella halophila TaxID=1783352 RepID=A0A7W7RML0_9ACTN|nr:TetR/AcrR family transcriptional regulator [Lipingzhangella halophila]MBB4934775.1 AcrR family transcriptional regulator [Lipingzhangella halophila]
MTGMNEHTPQKRGPGRPRKTEAGNTKGALQQAALRLFARNGYAGTSIRAIAREVELSESVLYAHFASKQAIFDAILAEHGPQRPLDAAAGVDAGLAESDPPAYLRQLVRAFLDDWDRYDARLLISLMARDGLLHGPALQQALTATRDAAGEMFDRWITTGHLRADLGTPHELALSFTGPIGLNRILHLHAEATAHERTTAREEILHHVETFINAAFLPGTHPEHPPLG